VKSAFVVRILQMPNSEWQQPHQQYGAAASGATIFDYAIGSASGKTEVFIQR
jgi:hypothetical protein